MRETKSEAQDADDSHRPPPKKPGAADRLGVEPVGRLLLRFSIPAITGMVVSATYGFVDRIFIGRWVNDMALGGLALVMPLLTVSLAVSMLFGIGAANMISMRLGQGRKEEAENALAHCFFLLLGAGVLMTVVGLALLDPLLSILGAQEGSEALGYARAYFRIILFSSVFSMLAFGFSHCTRAQGFPVITMIALLIGAILNIAFDALFIVALGWGMEGAALATVIAQFVSMTWILGFSLSRKPVVRLRLRTFRPSLVIVRQIMSFGSAHFLYNITLSAVQILFNNIMFRYGAAALGVPHGGDIALAGMNIISGIQLMILMPIFGINQGAQPLLGYNYGAKKYDRVLRAYLLAVAAGTAVCVAGFAATMLFPTQLVMLFVVDGGDPLLIPFATRAMRVMFMMLPIVAFTLISTTFFVVTGRPKISVLLSLLRQCIILAPLALIFSRIWGMWGIIVATPVSDALVLLITGALIFFELRKLRGMRNIVPEAGAESAG